MLTLRQPVLRSGRLLRDLSKLPEITSWIHPLNAIWNAGAHLDSAKDSIHKTLIYRLSDENMQRVQYTFRIWYLWKGLSLPERFLPDYVDKQAKSAHSGTRKTRNSVAASSQAGRREDAANSGDKGEPQDAGDRNAGVDARRTRSQTGAIEGKSNAAQSTTSKDVTKGKAKPAPSANKSGRGQQGGRRGSSRGGRSGQRADLEAGPSSTRQASAEGSRRSTSKSTRRRTRSQKA